MIKGIVIALLMMELLSETAVESKIPTIPHNGQGQCLTENMKVIGC
jgi:hypothetical protein